MYSDRKENRISPAYIADRIIEHFNNWKVPLDKVVCIVMGKPGPTGKTWLCEQLKQHGVNAFELDLEQVKADIEYHDDKNHYKISTYDHTAYVVLNDILPQYVDTDEIKPWDDITTLYPKSMIMSPEEHRAYMQAMKTKMNSVYGAGNYCYGMTGGYTIPPLGRANGKSMYQSEYWKALVNAKSNSKKIPTIQNVIFNEPATIVFWKDGTKTVVKTQDGEEYDPEKGLAMAISKKAMGNNRDYYLTFKKYLKKYDKQYPELPQISFEEAIKRAGDAASKVAFAFADDFKKSDNK